MTVSLFCFSFYTMCIKGDRDSQVKSNAIWTGCHCKSRSNVLLYWYRWCLSDNLRQLMKESNELAWASAYLEHPKSYRMKK